MKIYEHDIRQTMVNLPYFNYEVPILYMRDGTPYIPVINLCRMLGLNASTHIRRWRKLLLWTSAQKLPLQTSTGKRRVVWCLHLGALPFWYYCFDWKFVCPERQEQLQKVSDELQEIPDRIHQEMLTHYRQIRRFLFWFITSYIDADLALAQLSQKMQSALDSEDYVWLDELITSGRKIINDTNVIAKKMVQEQKNNPIIDAYNTDHYGAIVEAFSLPLLPFISYKDEEQLFEYVEILKEWYQDMTAFLQEHGFF